MSYERHPLSAAWPDMARDEFDALVLSIQEHGQREPIMLYDGQVLDGWHRLQACESAGRKPQFAAFEGSLEDAEAFVCDKHTRRSLTATQRAAAVLAMYSWRTGAGQPKKNRLPDSQLTTEELANKAHVSVATVKKVKEALSAAPERVEDMRSGKVSATTVVRQSEPKKAAPQKPVEKPEAPAIDLQAKHDDLKDRYDDLVLSAKELADQVQTLDAIKAGETEVAKEMNRLRAQVRSLEEVRDRLMTTNAEQVRQIKGQQKTIAKLEAQIAEQKAVAEAEF